MWRVLTVLGILVLLTTPCYAMTAHDLAMSYILHDQDPKEPGEKIKNGSTNEPILMHTTAYYQGEIGSHGDRMREGYVAGDPNLYGAAVVIYEAIPQENGSYTIGDYIGTYEMRDTGYGFSTGSGNSVVSSRKYAGTIETGIHLDIYRNNYSRCVEWMKRTQGYVFAVIVPQAKG